MTGQVIAGSIVELCVNALILRCFRSFLFSSFFSSFNSVSAAFLVLFPFLKALKAKAGDTLRLPRHAGSSAGILLTVHHER